jgi:ABC-type sugar transport system substrate-binding protein
MKGFTKGFSIVLMLLMVTMTVTAGGAQESDGIVIGYATKSATNQGWIIINNGAKQAAADYGVELLMVGPPKENDIAGQLGVVEDMINSQVDAIAIAPTDSSAIVVAVEKANKAGIPVVAVDTAIKGGDIASYVATDNYLAASVGAAWMAEQLGGTGNVVMINGMIAQETGAARRDGFYDLMKKDYPGIEIIMEVATDWQAERAMAAMEDALQAHDVIDGVFCAWDGGTIAALSAIEQSGRSDDIVLLGFDCAPDALKAMKQGKVQGDVAQFLYMIGYKGIEAAVKAAKGEPVEKRIDTGTMIVTPENVDAFIEDNHLTIN